MVSHRHHLVSRGYQRFFADGEQVRLIDMRSHTYLPAGTRDVFVEANFNSWRDDDGWNDELEQTWRNKVEGTAIGLVGQLIEGKAGDIQRDAAKALAALHLARSYSFDIVHNRILTQVGANEMRLVEEDPFYADLFTAEAGRAPEPDELAERVRLTVEAMKSGKQFLLERMVYLFNFTLEFFLTLNVALLYAPPGMSFLTGTLRSSPGTNAASGSASVRAWHSGTPSVSSCLSAGRSRWISTHLRRHPTRSYIRGRFRCSTFSSQDRRCAFSPVTHLTIQLGSWPIGHTFRLPIRTSHATMNAGHEVSRPKRPLVAVGSWRYPPQNRMTATAPRKTV